MLREDEKTVGGLLRTLPARAKRVSATLEKLVAVASDNGQSKKGLMARLKDEVYCITTSTNADREVGLPADARYDAARLILQLVSQLPIDVYVSDITGCRRLRSLPAPSLL